VPLWIEWLPESMKHSPSWNLNNLSGNQETSAFYALWIFISVNNTTPPVPTLSQINTANTLFYSFHIYHNIILSSKPCTSKSSLSFKSAHQNIVCDSHFPFSWHMLHPLHSPWFYHQNNILEEVQIMKLLTTKFSLASWYSLPLRNLSVAYNGLAEWPLPTNLGAGP